MDYQNPNADELLNKRIAKTRSEVDTLIANIETVIKGKHDVIERVVLALLADGHVMLLDVPGVGKTMLAKALARSFDTDFKRIQFTPDLLPTDITGVNIFDPKDREFKFQPGPVFTHILLADEINRASPKTQSALLEAMEERQVSVDNVQYKLGKPFFVIATKNPIEHAGTYPLPAAQLDRFMMRVSIGYPSKETEVEILASQSKRVTPLETLKPVATVEQIVEWQDNTADIYVAPAIDSFIVDLCRATREDASTYGVSTRAGIMLRKIARANALVNGRDYVIPDDVLRVLSDVFAHRLGGNGKVGEAIIDDIKARVIV